MTMFRLTLTLLVAGFCTILTTDARAEEAPWGPTIIKLGDITISCEAYEKYYRDIVEDAAKNNSPKWNAAAKSRLDEAFGTYKTAWISSSTVIKDYYGKKLPTHKSIHDIECETKYKNTTYTNTSGHHSSTKREPYIVKKHTYDQVRLGYVDDCKIEVAQDIWPELGKCGTGTIIRNFTIGVWCGGQDYTLRLTQKIHVVPSCSFSKQMLNIPDVQFMCGPIKYVDNNHVKLPDYIKPVTLHDGWDSSCRSSKIYVSYYDKEYKMIQEHRQYVIIRTWVFSDKCSGKKIEAEQKIMVNGLCNDEDPDKPDEPEPEEPEPDEPENDTIQFALLHSLEDVHISQKTYLDTYKGVVDLSLEAFRKGQTDLSAELLNAIFGTYSIQSDTNMVDSVTVYSMECNGGNPIDSEFKIKNGVIQSDCPDKLSIHQKLSEEFTNCGSTGLIREFIVESQCDTVVMRDTFVQRIVFSPTCALTDAVFEVPADTVLCGTIQRDTSNKIVLPVNDQPVYIGDSMRSFEVEYKFQLAYSSEDPDRTEITRIWTYTDTCLNETTMLTQELILMDTCMSNLERAMSREIVRKVAKENIEWGIADEVKLEMAANNHLENDEAFAYPNPFTREVTVNFYKHDRGQTHIRVLDSRGRFISERRFDLDTGSQRINLTGDMFRVSGLYILQLVSGDHIENLRLMYQGE